MAFTFFKMVDTVLTDSAFFIQLFKNYDKVVFSRLKEKLNRFEESKFL